MNCPFCGYGESKVMDSRPTEGKIRRRRECVSCGGRFTTYEIIEETPLMVVKKSKIRQEFNRDKIINGILRACEKRPVSIEQVEQIVLDIENYCKNSLMREVSTEYLGELILQKLKDVDLVAYIRFASVYRDYQDLDSFNRELKALQKNSK